MHGSQGIMVDNYPRPESGEACRHSYLATIIPIATMHQWIINLVALEKRRTRAKFIFTNVYI